MPPDKENVPETTSNPVSERDLIDDCIFNFGAIVRVDGNTFVMREYDFASDTDVDQSYRVTPSTEYGNILHLAQLSPGDSVVIDYLQQGETRIVRTLVRENVDPDDSRPDQ